MDVVHLSRRRRADGSTLRAANGWSRPWRFGIAAIAFVSIASLPLPSRPVQAAAPPQASAANAAVSPERALLNRYCVGCHNQRQKEAGATPVALDALDLDRIGA